MTIADAQEETRTRFVGGFYGQLVSGVLWLVSASLAVWSSPQAAIATLVVGGFFIFPLTELLVRLGGARAVLSPTNSFRHLGMQAAFVLPLSMPLLLPVSLYRLNWFYPALMILLESALSAVRDALRNENVRGTRGSVGQWRSRHCHVLVKQLECRRLVHRCDAARVRGSRESAGGP